MMLQGKIPSDVVSKRQQFLHSMKKFVEEQKAKLQDALNKLGLHSDDLQEVEPKQVCPYNKDHNIPVKVFEKHVEKCRLLSAGCQKDQLEAQLQNLDFAYKDTDSVMKIEIDEKNLNKIIWDSCVQSGQVYTGHRRMPVSHIDESVDLTAEDRLAVYRHVVQTSHEAGKVLPVDRTDHLLTTDWGSLVKKGLLDEQNNKEYGSKLEQLAALRDMKRRRQSYRAKNTHVTKKSYTEIIREVIVNQMEIVAPTGTRAKGEHPSLDRPELQADPARGEQAEDYYDRRSSRNDRPTEREQRRGRSTDRQPRESSSSSRRHNSRERGARDAGSRHKLRDREFDSRHSSRSRDASSRSGRSRKRDDVSETSVERPYGDTTIKIEPGEIVDAEEGEVSVSAIDAEAAENDLDGGRKRRRSKSRKRGRSSSCSDSGSDGRSRKSKKSKHKKKHSKKHKRRD